MPHHDIAISCPIHDSFRVQQVAGMFDVPLAERASERFQVELPDETEPWQIGLIVGPSGSGKSTVARHMYRNDEARMTNDETTRSSFDIRHSSFAWPSDRAVIDSFGDLPVRRVVELFTAVGFGSPPSWVKPYAILSGGEKFRCDLARALAQGMTNDEARMTNDRALNSSLVVFDEFTSVVDRNVAQICSAAIAKGIRRAHIPCRFVAVTCHYDVAEWLEADWVLDMATGELQRRWLRRKDWPWRRPPVALQVHRCRLEAWQMFKRHHYLSGSLAPQSRCYLTTWNGTPVNFCATLPVIGKRAHRRFTRIVTLPDFQGIGVGMRAVAAVAELHRAEDLRINVTSSHPALIRHCQRSARWKAIDVKRYGSSRPGAKFRHYQTTSGRALVSFEYVRAGARDWGLETRG